MSQVPASITLPADYSSYVAALGGQRLPAAVIDLDLLESNAQDLLQRAGNLPVRLVSPSLRCVAVLRHVQKLDPRFRGLLCHSAAEAVWLSKQGFDDIVIARPTIDAIDLNLMARAVAEGRRLTLTVDDVRQVDVIEDTAREHAIELPLLLDLNLWSRFTGLSQGRYCSALREPRQASQLARRIRASSGGVSLRGVLGFEVQLSGVPPPPPGVAGVAARRRLERLRNTTVLRRQAFVQQLYDSGFDPALISAGSSDSLEAATADRLVNEICAGSGLYRNPAGNANALLQVLPVCRMIGKDTVVCAGNAALRPVLPSGAKRLNDRARYSNAAALRLAPGDHLALGAPVLFAADDGSAITERSARLLALRAGRVVDEWPTYRGEQQQFF